jgi:excisionase family DNA binding protein
VYSPTAIDTSEAIEDEAVAYSIDDVAERLSVHRTTVYDLLNRGELASIKIGTRRLIPRTALLALLRDPTRSYPTAS